MRASILTFIFIISEYSIRTGGDGNCGDPPKVTNAENLNSVTTFRFRMKCKNGYLRKAGTSNLYKCINNNWTNNLPLVCIPDPSLPRIPSTTLPHIPHSPITLLWSSPTPKIQNTTTQPSTSTTSPRTTFKVQTSGQPSQRPTTIEEPSVTISNTTRITPSSTTEKENLITLSTRSLSTTTTGSGEYEFHGSGKGITAAIVVPIIAGLAAAVAIFCLHRRSRLRAVSRHSVELMTQNPGSDQPLMKTHTFMSNCPPDSTQPPVAPVKNFPESTYTDTPLSA
ncbi:interleukin-15 receptor subunit alpha isoform X2 [Neoarius graeffei]|uniref:interleukin-15 receptor subunit alpha isoform X2 n=1 Tax=Neoarius graeffei TaxID=443677 RepID=UPI00298C917E|nr:interleukin-15 receptor subunit alpha isoform X2 [Neoarius graeffei]